MPALFKIKPHLWFAHEAEQAVAFYLSVFPDSRIERTLRYSEAGHEMHGMPAGSIMSIQFEIAGQPFEALNGGPLFQFSEAISFIVRCDTQEEIDYYWERLGEGGDPQAQACGWLKDRFGVSWQVVPDFLDVWDQEADPDAFERVMLAMLEMKKLDIAALERAWSGV